MKSMTRVLMGAAVLVALCVSRSPARADEDYVTQINQYVDQIYQDQADLDNYLNRISEDQQKLYDHVNDIWERTRPEQPAALPMQAPVAFPVQPPRLPLPMPFNPQQALAFQQMQAHQVMQIQAMQMQVLRMQAVQMQQLQRMRFHR